MKLKLTNIQVAALWALVYNLKLGDSNVFTNAMSDLVIKLEEKGAEDIFNEVLDAPVLRVVTDFTDGAYLEFVNQ
jgi:hypothetical protein